MNLDQVFKVFERAHQSTGHAEYVVIGSLSVLGIEDDHSVPSDMALSIDIDAYTRADPERILDLASELGEDSVFHRVQGYYLDPVSPHLPTLPEGWQSRLHCVERPPVKVWFLDPDDAAISKYARCEPRDIRWLRAGIAAGLLSLPRIRARLRSTRFLDADEEQRARAQIEADSAWLESGGSLQGGRSGSAD